MKKIFTIFCLNCLFLASSLTGNLSAQTTIGSGIPPIGGAILDLKEHAPDINNVTSEKGLAMPRVALTVANDLNDILTPPITADIRTAHEGLWVYNITENASFCPGLYVWNGVLWNPVKNVTPAIVTSADVNSNSFIIKQGTLFQFPVTKAYTIANDPTWGPILNTPLPTTPAAWDVQLVWQDNPGLIQSVSIVRDATLGQNSIMSVQTNALACAQGNALVAVTVNGVIRWTWHLWITDFDPTATQLSYNNGTTTNIFMDRNLGALANNGNTPRAAFRAMGLLYQMGRLAPTLGAAATTQANGTYASKPIYSISNVQLTEGTPTGGTGVNLLIVPATPLINLANALQNPLNVYYGGGVQNATGYDWYTSPGNGSATNQTLWSTAGGAKGVFDPCPAGWRVPIFTGLPSTSPWYNLPIAGYTAGAGMVSPVLGYYPATGSRTPLAGTFTGVGTSGNYNSSAIASPAIFMGFTISATPTFSASLSSARAGARSVRCIQGN